MTTVTVMDWRTRANIYASAALAVVQVWFPRKRPAGEAEHLADKLIERESTPTPTTGAPR